MTSENIIESTLRDLFEKIEFTAEPAGLYDPLRYMIAIGGKRIRPRLVLTSYGLFHDSFSPEVLHVAQALEVFHSFTLIHDDIMDRAPIRRGLPTVHTKWNDNTAILSGDVMVIDAYRRMAAAGCADAMDLFNKTAAEVCEGQQYDMEFESEESVPMAAYLKMIGLKTAVLIACAAREGAIMAGASQTVQKALYDFGYDLGLAFQVADDYLDTFGDVTVFGKSIGGDILCGKKTWLLTKAYELAGAGVAADGAACGGGICAADLTAALALPADTPEQKETKITTVRNMYIALGVDKAALEECRAYHCRALEHVSAIGLSDEQFASLKAYADSLVGRVK